MNKPWSDLPNAHHIDWVLASLKDNAHLWAEARNALRDAARAAAWRAAWGAARDAAWYAASDAGRGAAWSAALDSARWAAWRAASDAASDAAWRAASDAASDAAWRAAWGAVRALIAYDDCDQYLTMGYEELRIWAALSEHPAAVLLLSMVYVKSKTKAKISKKGLTTNKTAL